MLKQDSIQRYTELEGFEVANNEQAVFVRIL